MRQVLYAGGATFDGKEWFPNGLAVLVEGARIKRVAKIAEFDGFAGETVDTSGGALMPGLIDCHVHLTLGGEGDPGTAQLKQNLAQCALSAMKRAQETLAGGTVAVRDCGGRDYVDLAVRDAANRGDFVGPTVRAAGRLVCMTGGHGNRTGRVADGVDEVIKAVREQIHAGADFIKIMATGGVMTPGVNPEDAHYTRAEMVAGLAEARRFNKRSASHAQGAEGIMNAVVAGVSSIEHGIFMDDDCIKAMLEHGTYLVPTLAAVNNIIANKDRGIPSWAVEKSLRAYERHLESFRRFLAAGGKIALGTDAGTPFNIHGENAQELRLMVDAGMTPLQALIAGTSAAADLVGLPDHGTIAEGKLADLLMLDGDPIADINRAADRANHRFVLKNGVVAGSNEVATKAGGLAGSGPAARAAAF